MMNRILALMMFVLPLLSFAQDAKKVYLSGTDGEHTVQWDFYCTGGRKSGEWTKIAVPAHWEQEGFGHYDYGRDYRTYGKDFKFSDEAGLYKHSFEVPSNWKGKTINIVFEGSMTDTEVKINGELAGPIHQGAFYLFKYDISDKVQYGQTNTLEVKVSKMSANKSVNRAERYADYWIFGGIYRPVYLEVLPEYHLTKSSIVAEADGRFELHANLNKELSGAELSVQIFDASGNQVTSTKQKVKNGSAIANTTVENPKTWTSETPNRYLAKVSLTSGKKILYQKDIKFGFRTIEILEGNGVYVNGTKVKFKGVNRHCFWPETGRALSPRIDLMDAQLIREMNMNAVRCSHYPPDQSFLDICDSLGIYVIDELAGWQNAYDTEVGSKLVREMVERDVNHPSVIFWSNGNEGGTNTDLDDDYDLYDPSKRPVIHAHHKPGNDYNGIDTNHYESYESTSSILEGGLIYMPTEFLHGQDDGGMAASLKDYWELMWNSDRSAGGFLWAMLDEGIVRTDLNNSIDVNRLNAPDGVLGPHREKEGSFYALREIWSPIVVETEKLDASFKGKLMIENRYHFTNLRDCSFEWKLVDYPAPGSRENGFIVKQKGKVNGPDIAPVSKGELDLLLPQNFSQSQGLLLTAFDPFGKEVWTWSWLLKSNAEILQGMIDMTPGEVEVSQNDSLLTMKAAGITIGFDTRNGQLTGLKNDKGLDLLFGDGPLATEGETNFTGLQHYDEGDWHVVKVSYAGSLKSAQWKMSSSGWVELQYLYEAPGETLFPGLSFTYPESNIIGAKWLGSGPYRVWKNRMQGGTIGVWENLYNDTQTGYFPWKYPEFKGYFSDIVWLQINTSEGTFVVASGEEDLFVRLFDFTGLQGPEKYYPALPVGNLSFLDGIPPVGNKLATGIKEYSGDMGPSDELNELKGPVKRTLYFYFGLPVTNE